MPRNASGTYTLPSGNPVVSGTLIDATWANNTMADLGNEVTDSLSRSGEGAMLAPLRITDGVQATPSLAFSNEPSSGLYRAGTNEWWSVAAGVQVQQHTSTGAVTRFAAGAVGTPSVSAFNDVNTGIWFPAADTLAVSTAGVEALRVNSSGVLSLVNNPTLSGGTANGVLYLNGSKVATSGSALVFDGTNLGIGTASPAAKLHVSGQSRVADSSNAANYMTFGVGANAPFGNASISTTTAGLSIVAEGAGNMTFLNNGSEAMRIDTANNLGIGVTPSAWASGNRFIDVNASASYGAFGNTDAMMLANAFWNGSNWIRKNDGNAFRFVIESVSTAPTINWQVAANSTAGSTISFTQALTLNSNGNLALQGGTTSASGVGVTFPASQSASTDANCLDDYEEGTFTPTFVGSTTNPTYTTSDLHGSYTKIGRVVYFSIGISVSGVTAQGTGGLQIGGLPFTVFSSIYSSPVLIGYNDVFDTDFKTAYALSGDTKLQVIPTGVTQSNAQWGTPASATTSPLSTGYISIQGFYIVS
jgi:hypothetical protein